MNKEGEFMLLCGCTPKYQNMHRKVELSIAQLSIMVQLNG